MLCVIRTTADADALKPEIVGKEEIVQWCAACILYFLLQGVHLGERKHLHSLFIALLAIFEAFFQRHDQNGSRVCERRWRVALMGVTGHKYVIAGPARS
jgi:hypothetical protein